LARYFRVLRTEPDEKGGLVYIGAGTLALILIIVLLIWLL
jgi:hypothetical protein